MLFKALYKYCSDLADNGQYVGNIREIVAAGGAKSLAAIDAWGLYGLCRQ